jgi:hypothetical protein
LSLLPQPFLDHGNRKPLAVSATHHSPAERREHPRHRVFKRVKAIFDNRSVIDCVMRDLSVGGARLTCRQAALLPERFQLVFMTERDMRDVRVAWRGIDEIGVQFTTPPRKALHLLL